MCNNTVSIWIPDRTNTATLEFEAGHFAERNCGATNYSGNMQLCNACESSHKPTPEWETDNPAWEY
tara:strand:- start:793 stop:990 length:198 start_codon:yes stop_codon:yes gene_type:complete